LELPGFSDLWKTIQKGSFAYNTLFLGISPLTHSSATDLADITTLTLFFGDEFIDGVAADAGKPFIRALIKKKNDKFYLQKKIVDGKVSLQYCIDMNQLLPPHVVQNINVQYQISYQRFYDLLLCFLGLINDRLGKLPASMAEKAADKLADACNTCFESFMHDVNSCPVAGNIPVIQDVLHFHETKTAFMQKKLLELRCILVNKEDAMNSIQTRGWLDIMRVIQIYDDIHDVLIDDGLQDNLVLSIAFHYFPDEWIWFCTNKHLAELNQQQAFLYSLYMPGTMEYCLQLASDKIRTMNWEQQKIMHYLLFKNKYAFYIENPEEGLTDNKDFLMFFYGRIKERMSHLSVEAIKSFVINTCMHVRSTRNILLAKIDFVTAYQLRYNLLAMSTETKAGIFDLVIADS
jgi:hypothetical protein